VQSRGVAGERGRWCRWFGGLQCENGGGFHSGLQRGANLLLQWLLFRCAGAGINGCVFRQGAMVVRG